MTKVFVYAILVYICAAKWGIAVKIELFGEVKSVANIPSGDIFSTLLPNGRFARFMKITGRGETENIYLGSIAIGPYFDDDRPVQFYTPELVGLDDLVLHEHGITLGPMRSSDANVVTDKDPSAHPLGSLTVTADNRLLLRFRNQRRAGFVNLHDGKFTDLSAKEIVAVYPHYCLTGPDESGAIKILFASMRLDPQPSFALTEYPSHAYSP